MHGFGYFVDQCDLLISLRDWPGRGGDPPGKYIAMHYYYLKLISAVIYCAINSTIKSSSNKSNDANTVKQSFVKCSFPAASSVKNSTGTFNWVNKALCTTRFVSLLKDHCFFRINIACKTCRKTQRINKYDYIEHGKRQLDFCSSSCNYVINDYSTEFISVEISIKTRQNTSLHFTHAS